MRRHVITFNGILQCQIGFSYNMKINIINIGNSQGLILPTTILRQLNLSKGSTVELTISNGSILIKPEPRQGWAEAAHLVYTAGKNQLLPDLTNEFEKKEWTW